MSEVTAAAAPAAPKKVAKKSRKPAAQVAAEAPKPAPVTLDILTAVLDKFQGTVGDKLNEHAGKVENALTAERQARMSAEKRMQQIESNLQDMPNRVSKAVREHLEKDVLAIVEIHAGKMFRKGLAQTIVAGACFPYTAVVGAGHAVGKLIRSKSADAEVAGQPAPARA